jgi:primosomal protein N' (replication factor Y) (superfamily II helicase)
MRPPLQNALAGRLVALCVGVYIIKGMYALVKLFSGYRTSLWYHIPSHLPTLSADDLIRVPLRKQIVTALILRTTATVPLTDILLKDVIGKEFLPHDPHYMSFVKTLSYLYQIEPTYCMQRLQVFLREKEVAVEDVVPKIDTDTQMPLLTTQQEAVCLFMRSHITNGLHTITLLHGVTGSGKTEVYKNLILHALAENKTIILLLPEVTLAIAFEHRLRKELPSWCTLYGFHSGKTVKEKKILWGELLAAKPMLIIGVHLPVFLPITNLGLIIIDEEHELGYQEKRHPKINSKEAAFLKARLGNIPVLVGSATPSLRALYAVKQKKWYFFQLTERFGGSFPAIEVVSLRVKNRRLHFWITQQLQVAIADRLQKKEQVIIFLNRRGYSFFVQCSGCSFIFCCARCSVSLTLHQENKLYCHYCGFSKVLDSCCPSCKKSGESFLKKGIGTQQAVTILQELFPTARIARADMDTTSKKKEWQKTIVDFEKGEIDILVGTQTITKGYHFPRVTLVGIIWADLNLHFPMFNATETTLQQLIQVAGRAGRASLNGRVIVQTMNDHAITDYLNERDYVKFYTNEIQSRISVGYPPYIFLIEIELKHKSEKIVDAEIAHCAAALRAAVGNAQAEILGPVQPMVHKISNIHLRTVYIKAARFETAVQMYQSLKNSAYKSTIFFTPIF